LRLVPDEFDGLLEDVSDGVIRVVIAIGPRKNDNSKFHCGGSPLLLAGTLILAHLSAGHTSAWTSSLSRFQGVTQRRELCCVDV